MAQRIQTICAEPCCKRLVSKGRCDEHQTDYESARLASYNKRPDASARGYTSVRWKEIRRMRIKKDKGICQDCGDDGASHVDHVIPKSRGGRDTLANTQLLCHPCHSRKTLGEQRARRM